MTIPSAEKQKLKELEQKIVLAKGDNKEQRKAPDAHKNVHYAWRMILELATHWTNG